MTPPTLFPTNPQALPLMYSSIAGFLFLLLLAPVVESQDSFRLPERVLYYGRARFLGINNISIPKSALELPEEALEVDRVWRRGPSPASSLFRKGTLMRNNGLPETPARALTVDSLPLGSAKGFNGINAVQNSLSGVGAYKSSQGNATPPDVSLCIGNGYIVQPLNLAIAVYNRTTGKLMAGILALNQFLGLQPRIIQNGTAVGRGDGLSDPHCVYDKDTKRFFMSVVWFATGSNVASLDKFGQTRVGGEGERYGTGVIIAVSSKGDPRQPWRVYFIPGTNDGINSNNDTAAPLFYGEATEVQDYPQITVNAHGVYISTRQFLYQRGFAGGNIYALSKASLVRGLSFFQAVRFAIPRLRTPYCDFLRPARSAGDSAYSTEAGGVAFFLATQALVFPGSRQNSVGLWVLSNTATLSNFLFPTPRLRFKIVTFRSTWRVQDNPIEQRNSSVGLDSGGDAVQSASVRSNGRVAFTVSSAFQTTASVGVTFGLLQVQVSSRSVSVKVERFTSFGVKGQSLLYPAVALNRDNKGLISFALVGRQYYPTAAYTIVRAGGRVDPVKIAASGKAPLNDNGRGRYGDWQTVEIDEQGKAWAAVEYVSGAYKGTQFFNWATYIFSVSL